MATRSRMMSQYPVPPDRGSLPTSEEACQILQRAFRDNLYPSSLDFKLLKAVTGMEVEEIRKWFSKARAQQRRDASQVDVPFRAFRSLEKFYREKHNPTMAEMRLISEEINLSLPQVRDFFGKKWHQRVEEEGAFPMSIAQTSEDHLVSI